MAAVKIQRRHSPKKTESASDALAPSPGRRLRQAREAMGMEVATVAEQLHLSKAMVQALEEENYEALPARVFVRGYYRNFARLVGVPEDIVLEEFGQLCPEGEDCSVPPAVAQGIRKEIHSNHGLVRLATWLIVIALLTMFGLWWKSYLDKKAPVDAPVVQTETAPAAEMEKSPAAAAPSPAVVQAPKPVVRPETVEEPQETVADAPAAEVASSEPPVASQASSPPEEAVQQVVAPPRVLLSFRGDCWVDVRDSSRSFKLVGRRQAGDVFELKGEAPYKMVLGNARNVSITIDGSPFDLAPYTKGNVAKLTFNPTSN